MTDELFSFLVFRYIEAAAARPVVEADLASQDLEHFLSNDNMLSDTLSRARTSHEDLRIIQAYLELDLDDRRDLNPTIHEWVLERIAQGSIPEDIQRAATVAAEAFFIDGPPIMLLLAVNALIALDSKADMDDSFIRLISDSLTQRDDAAEHLGNLTDILLDLNFLIANLAALRALRNLHAADRTQIVRERLLTRAETLGGEQGAALRAIATR